jgi:hypothetical protein
MKHHLQNAKKYQQIRWRKLLPFLPMVFMLTSCLTALSTETGVTVWKGEKWKIQTEIVLSIIDVETYGFLIDQSFNEYVSDLVAAGITAEWQQVNQSQAEGVTYRITLEGEGYEKLNQAVFAGKQVFVVDDSSGDRLIRFHYRAGTDLLGMAKNETYILNGGKIISSNGSQSGRNTVTWVNPTTTMEAVLTEASRYTWMLYFTIALLIAIAGWFVYQFFFKRSKTPSSPATFASELASTSRFCPHCGTKIPNQAGFCPQCGNNL